MLYRDCQRLVNQDRNVFAACMVACGDADAMVTGVTRNSFDVLDEVSRVIAVKPDCVLFGLTMLLARERTVLLADTLVHEVPSSAQLADIADRRRRPRRASSGSSRGSRCCPIRISAIRWARTASACARRWRCSTQRSVDFEYDGEMSADVALDERLMRQLYPFCRLSARPTSWSCPNCTAPTSRPSCCRISAAGRSVGPLLIGLSHPVQIVNIGATVSDLVNLAALSAHDAIR